MRASVAIGVAAAAIVGVASQAGAAELVVNGSFSAGNSGFSSDYPYVPPQSPPVVTSPSYAIGTDAATVGNASFDWGGFGDHTSGTGNMLVADGARGRAWYQTIALQSGTTYDWSFWAHTVQRNSGTAALLTMNIDSISLSGPLGLPDTSVSAWQQLSGSFTSAFTGSVVLSIFDSNGSVSFNDFALDDISFASRDAAPGAVPEPATWGTMLLGFGLIGAAARRRRPARILA